MNQRSIRGVHGRTWLEGRGGRVLERGQRRDHRVRAVNYSSVAMLIHVEAEPSTSAAPLHWGTPPVPKWTPQKQLLSEAGFGHPEVLFSEVLGHADLAGSCGPSHPVAVRVECEDPASAAVHPLFTLGLDIRCRS